MTPSRCESGAENGKINGKGQERAGGATRSGR